MSRVAALLGPAAALLLVACAGAPPVPAPGDSGSAVPRAGGTTAPPPTAAAPLAELATRFAARAVSQEAAGNPRQALDSWKVVATLRPAAAEPRRRVEELTARLATEAERRYGNGLARLRERQPEAARRELLLALAADPDHAGALDALANLVEPDAATYTVAGGDTFETIAKKRYGDPALAPVVARVNDLDPDATPVAGSVLVLPDLAPPAAKATGRPAPEAAAEGPDSGYGAEPAPLGGEGPAPTAQDELLPAPDNDEANFARAKELFQAKRFEDAGSAADRLARSPAFGARARELSGNAWFAAGDAALKEERFADALAAYRKAEPARRDVPAALAAVERRKKEKAEESYNAGVRFFVNRMLGEAIRSWELTLALNPGHPKAPRDMAKARELLQKLEELR